MPSAAQRPRRSAAAAASSASASALGRSASKAKSSSSSGANSSTGSSGGGSGSSGTGRERGIERLIDADPGGPYFRVSRILSEAPAAVQAARTGRILPSALAEQAMALSKYEIALPVGGAPTSVAGIPKSGRAGRAGEDDTAGTTANTVRRVIDRLETEILGPEYPLVTGAPCGEEDAQAKEEVQQPDDGGIPIAEEGMTTPHVKPTSYSEAVAAATPAAAPTTLEFGSSSSGGDAAARASSRPDAPLRQPPRHRRRPQRGVLKQRGDQGSVGGVGSYAGDAAAEEDENRRDIDESSRRLTRERILRHHDKLITVQSQTAATAATAAATVTASVPGKEAEKEDVENQEGDKEEADPTPPTLPTELCSSLRQLLGSGSNDESESAPDSVMSALLNTISAHPIFASTSAKDSGSGGRTDPGAEGLSLEAIVGKAVRIATSDTGSEDKDAFQALIIAALSVVTSNLSMPSSTDSTSGAEDIAETPTVQVGAVLSLLADLSGVPLASATSKSAAASSLIPSDLLAYLSAASSTYEERIEIQKERALARMARERARKEAKALKEAAKRAEEEAGRAILEDNTLSDVDSDPASTVDLTDALAQQEPSAEVAVQIRNNDVDQGAEVLAVGDAAVNAAIADVLDDDGGDDNLPRANRVGLSPPVSMENSDSSADEEVSTGGGGAFDILDDESSSSDSSDSENDDAISEGGMSNSDNESEADDRDEEEVSEGDEDEETDEDELLARALALSLAEHNAALAESQDVSESAESAETALSNVGSETVEEVTSEEAISPVDGGASIELLSTPRAALFGGSGQDTTPASASEADPALLTPRSAEDQSEDDESLEDEEEDLPPLPPPPTFGYPYKAQLGPYQTFVTPAEDVAAVPPNLDPSNLADFGGLPLPIALLHVLRCSLARLCPSAFLSPSEENTSSIIGKRDMQLGSSCAVGVGSSLFPPLSQSFVTEAEADDDADASTVLPNHTVSGGKCSLLPHQINAHMLIALLSLITSAREDAFCALQLARSELNSHVETGNKSERPVGEAGEEKEMEGVEDPASAAAAALAISSSTAAYSRNTSSDNLEAKGLKRKAAAAAQVEALRREVAERRVEIISRSVSAYSSSVWLVMRCLRFIVSSFGINDTFPAETRANLSAAIAVFTPTPKADTDELGDALLTAPLRREAFLLWKDCIPLLYSTQDAMTELLGSLLHECFSATDEDVEGPTTSDYNESLLKLKVMCLRFRQSDILDRFAALPKEFDSDEMCTKKGDGKEEALLEPSRLQPMISLLAPIVPKALDSEIWRLYCALCGRANRLLLWDSAGTESLSDGIGVNTSTSSGSAADGAGGSFQLKASPLILDFDGQKCADSIAIIPNAPGNPNGVVGHQRASKVWGTVLGTQAFHPKTGIHRYAVRLDKCERGHVFVGVATSQASTKTYVGGDKHGWGVIGTQALWHDRSKIRGDYGATFRTGATVVITLDTDAGTLSFGLWKDPQQAKDSEGLSGTVGSPISLASPRRSSSGINAGVPVLEDWGVAFEGLPLDGRLYPAVGLYQRDDKVTLLSVTSSTKGEGGGRAGATLGGDIGSGECFYPRPSTLSKLPPGTTSVAETVCAWNDKLNRDAISYAASVLSKSAQILSSEPDSGNHDGLVNEILPSVASSLCLQGPYIPTLSGRTARTLLPLVMECAIMLDKRLQSNETPRYSLMGIGSGRWVIRSSNAMEASSGDTKSDELEEYVVHLKRVNTSDSFGSDSGVHGVGVGTSGRSKGGRVEVSGGVRGSTLTLIEERSDDGPLALPSFSQAKSSKASRLIEAHISVDGSRVEGSYRDMQSGTIGRVAGVYEPENEGFPTSSNIEADNSRCTVDTITLLVQAACRLAINISSGSSAEDLLDECCNDGQRPSKAMQDLLSSSAILGKGRPGFDSDISLVRSLFVAPTFVEEHAQHTIASWEEVVFFPLVQSKASPEELRTSPVLVSEVADDRIAAEAGGKGSLSILAPSLYRSARMGVISVLLHHLGGSTNVDLDSVAKGGEIAAEALPLWRQALHITEAGVRSAILDESPFHGSRKEKCQSYCKLLRLVSDFLLELPAYCPEGSSPSSREEVDVIFDDISTIYSAIKRAEDLVGLETQMNFLTKSGIARSVSLTCVSKLFQEVRCRPSVEAIVASLPRLMNANAAFSPLSPSGFTGNTSVPSLATNGSSSKRREGVLPSTGTHLISAVQGCSSSVQQVLKSQVHSIYSAAGRAFTDALAALEKENIHFSSESQSLCLSIVGALLSTMGFADVSVIVEKSGLLKSLSTVLSKYHSSLPHAFDPSEESNQTDCDTKDCIDQLLLSLNLSCSRKIARYSLLLLHSYAYHLSALEPSGQTALVSDFTELVSSHGSEVIGALSEVESTNRAMKSSSTALADWEEWTKICLDNGVQPLGNEKVEKKLDHTRDALAFAQRCIDFGSISQASKHDSIALSSSSASVQCLLLMQQANSCVNVLNTMSRSTVFARSLSNDEDRMGALLRFSGLISLNAGPDSALTERDFVPVVIRIRLVRLLMRLLPFRDPDEAIIMGCLRLLGTGNWKSSPSEIDGDGEVGCGENVSRESLALATNSLLRHLYSTSDPYKLAIDQIIKKTSREDFGDAEIVKRGILAFLGGLPGRISEGSFVLLKPAAAAALSPNSSIGKSSALGGASSVSAAPLVVGSEAVVTGLCRRNAMAGVVTGIDTAKGTCEVVLFDRKLAANADGSVLSTPSLKQSGVTIRAVRAQLPDVVSAEEMPLLLDSDMDFNDVVSTSLSETIGRLSTLFGKDGEQGHITGEGLESSILSLRASLVLLSDQGILRRFVDGDESSRSILSQLLEFASTTAGSISNDQGNVSSGEGISATPEHEARYLYLRRMLVETAVRQRCFESKPSYEWDQLLQDSQRKSKKKSDTNTDGKNVSDTHSSSTARQVAATSTESSFARRSLSEETTAASRSSDATEQTANRRTSAGRSTSRTEYEDGDGQNEQEEDEEDEHLREAAIVQMAELGLPRSWAELALRRVGGTNIEAAVHFCLERGADMERLLEEERERERRLASESGGRRRNASGSGTNTNYLIQQLVEMGFPAHWCSEALAATGTSSVDEALTWILTNGERLSAQDANDEDDDDDEDDEDYDEDDDDDDDDEQSDQDVDAEDNEEDDVSDVVPGATKETAGTNASSEAAGNVPGVHVAPKGWCPNVACPLRSVSGKAQINTRSLVVSGLPTGGFSSVGTKGVLLTSGKWYYETELITANCLQVGWADASFAGHCSADRGDGCGDGPSSWAFDGWRRYRWHSSATEWGCRWQEGDIVGCLVDMDDRTVSFTLNGRAEEIGMGVAFSGDGFRPCGGVYACVSFNRRERVRLILGGRDSENFRYPPPEGYRGVGEAVHNAAEEFAMLAKEEEILDGPEMKSEENDGAKPVKFLCDFSEGEHGHELYAWQHRYYGADASVHLGGGGRPMSSRGGRREGTKAAMGPSNEDGMVSSAVTSRLIQEWKKNIDNTNEENPEDDGHIESSRNSASIVKSISDGYNAAIRSIEGEILGECTSLCLLYTRKLIVHVLITLGKDFRMSNFITDPSSNEEGIDVARKLWSIIEKCCSLPGWVGEAGAMAIAAEALGLGISTGGDGAETVAGVVETEHSAIACGGISQLLSSAMLPSGGGTDKSNSRGNDPSNGLAACAEAALGSDGGGSLVFLRDSLQAAAAHSSAFRKILVAAVRRSIRLLSTVESDVLENSKNISDGSGADDESTEAVEDDDLEEYNVVTGPETAKLDQRTAPDARLISFVSGLLLSKPVRVASSNAVHMDAAMVSSHLLEAWSLGLLSASMPWRMVCAMTSSGILDDNGDALNYLLNRSPTLAELYCRLPSIVARRAWCERAALPICSRYAQAYIELLSSVQAAGGSRLLMSPDDISTDAAMPRPLPRLHACSELSTSSWEWEEGFVGSDAGFETWTGSVEVFPVSWQAPPRSAVKALMDGGDGPPMLREGCTVIRSKDWAGRYEDGQDVYEAAKAARDKAKKEEQNAMKAIANETNKTASFAATAAVSEEEEIQDVQDEVVAAEEVNPAEETSAEVEVGESEVSGSDEGVDAVLPDSSQSPSPEPLPESPPGPTSPPAEPPVPSEEESAPSASPRKQKKAPSPKLPIGTVVSIEPWNGVPGLGRRVRWHLTGEEGVYRYGGDGGRFDIAHVEVNDKETRVKKRHPHPESVEQCAARYGFGKGQRFNVLLRLSRHGSYCEDDASDFLHQGILEWPDFGAGVRVQCRFHSDGALTITEQELLFGSKDSGWEARFGQPSYIPGQVMVLSPTVGSPDEGTDAASSQYERLLGSASFVAPTLRDRKDGGKVRVATEMQLRRSRRSSSGDATDVHPSSKLTEGVPSGPAPLSPPLSFDKDCHAPSIALSCDGRTATCITSDGRGTAFAAAGFTKGIHYWEVKIEHADVGSIFIGVAEKPTPSNGGGSSSSGYGIEGNKLQRWFGMGFVNFRATYTAGAERVYGAHCHKGDIVGVLLDCDAGRISFFYDGLKYGEHILNDLGCAFENNSPFGFNADGCGTGGAGQGAPSGADGSGRGGRLPANGAVRMKALWPVIGLRTPGDRVTMSCKWTSSFGVDGVSMLRNAIAVDQILRRYEQAPTGNHSTLPDWFIEESYKEYERWRSGRWLRTTTRGSGPHPLTCSTLDVDIDVSPIACASACASLGLRKALLPGDRVAIKRSNGRILEMDEEALVLGACQGRLYYQIISQKSEGGALSEGGGRAWFWDESEVIDGGLQIIGKARGLDIDLPLLQRFKCSSAGGLRVVYSGGAVVRSDLEIIDGSMNLGTIPHGTVIPKCDVLERRVNSCGVVRYRIKYEDICSEGWISSKIRGGKEEAIVDLLSKAPTHVPERTTEDASETTDDGIKSEEEYEEKESIGSNSSKKGDEIFVCANDVARSWYAAYRKAIEKGGIYVASENENSDWAIKDSAEFKSLLTSSISENMSELQADAIIGSAVSAIANFSRTGDATECSFDAVASAFAFSISVKEPKDDGTDEEKKINVVSASEANKAAASVLSHLGTSPKSIKALLVRVAMLRALNRRAHYALSWLPVRPAQENSSVLGGLAGFGTSCERIGRSRLISASADWIQAPSIAGRVRNCRRLLFGSVKRSLLDGLLLATTTPTPLPHDEYELPREVRTVRVNRLKARRAMGSKSTTSKKKHSVFAQLQHETRGWSGAALRRGHVAKGHGGQKRSFKVKLVGEGVNDYSGPYREVFTDAMGEVLAIDDSGHGVLGVLDPSPNQSSAIGEGRELFVFAPHGAKSAVGSDNGTVSTEEVAIRNCFANFLLNRHENVREAEDSVLFLGKLAGTACRHSIPVDIFLPLGIVWNRLAEDDFDASRALSEIDTLACKQLEESAPADSLVLESHPTLVVQQHMLNSLADGLGSVLPMEIMPVFSGAELRDVMCGSPEIDVDLLRRVVEYEGYDEEDSVIQYFWETLEEMTREERRLFLQFVWARTRLPMKESDFEAPFKILRDAKSDETEVEEALPSASTCFFSLTLPEYKSKEVLKRKLVFAIKNVTTMESDYVTNDAEIGEGWRGM